MQQLENDKKYPGCQNGKTQLLIWREIKKKRKNFKKLKANAKFNIP